jgi:uncharacterized alkaline shock family protein YloU
MADYQARRTYMTEIKSSESGCVRIADEVLAVIAGTAALEIEGVAGLTGHLADDIAEKLGRRHLGKGVTVKVENGAVAVATEICVKPGSKFQEIGAAVQERIKTAIETMTGLDVSEVNVGISALAAEKADPIKKPRKA